MLWPRIMTAMVTPFTDNQELDERRAENLAAWLVRHGSGGLVIAGTTGESPTLTEYEREILYHAARRGAGDVPIFVGTGSNDTRHAVAMAKAAERWGADGLLVVTPYYNKPSADGLLAHYRAIADSVQLPIMVYNVPGRTGVNMDPRTVQRLNQACPNVQAIKEAGGQLETIERLLEDCPSMFIYSGDDLLFYPSLAVGAYGVVSVASHIVGEEMATMCQAFLEGHIDRARELHRLLRPVFRDLFAWPNPIPLKWIMNALGISVGPLRLPLVFPENTEALDRLYQYITQVVRPDRAGSYALV
ncbi:MAG: 4-hydroxy-tetrahydrodipicolinate synthase [Firmicutes bacterium]|nr:4-hydroxy-tetrahydrodipicolinate synthase [Bacillota bacterium]